MDNIGNIFLGGILISSVLAVAYRGFVLSSRPVSDVYTHDKGKAKYGKHVGYVDDGKISKELRDAVYEEHGEKCAITRRRGYRGNADTNGEHVLVGFGVKVELQLNHIIPRRLGGPTKKWNLIPIDAKLNNAIKDKITPMAEELLRERKELMWSRGIRKTRFTDEKKKLAQKRMWKFSLN